MAQSPLQNRAKRQSAWRQGCRSRRSRLGRGGAMLISRGAELAACARAGGAPHRLGASAEPEVLCPDHGLRRTRTGDGSACLCTTHPGAVALDLDGIGKVRADAVETFSKPTTSPSR
jgi:hypothetical protein